MSAILRRLKGSPKTGKDTMEKADSGSDSSGCEGGLEKATFAMS